MNGIPASALYSDCSREVGEVALHYPNTFITTHPASAAIAFGVGVSKGSGDSVAVVGGDSARVAGIAVRSFEAADLDNNEYGVSDPVGVLRSGIVSCQIATAVVKGDQVYLIHTTIDAAHTAGMFTNVATAGKTFLINGAEFMSSGDAAGTAALYLPSGFSVTATPAS